MLGDLPKGWQAVRLGKLARERSERNQSGAVMPVLSMTKHRGFVRSSEYFTRSVHSDNTDNYKVVRRGQFAYATIHLDEGSIDYLRDFDAGLISPMYTVFELTSDVVDRDFVFRSLKRFALSGHFDPYSNGGVNRRKSISFGDLKAFNFPIPPLAEQRAIADVLCAVEAAIRKTEALISQTRTLMTLTMADSLAELAASSTIISLGQVLAEGPKSGLSPVCKDEPPGIGVLRLGAVSDGQLKWYGHVKYSDVAEECVRRFQLRANDFLIVRGNGSRDIVGSGCLVSAKAVPPFACIFPDLLIRIRVNEKAILPEFLAAIWTSEHLRTQIRQSLKSTNGIFKINQTDIRELRIPLPTLEQQHRLSSLFTSMSERLLAEQEGASQLRQLRDALAQELLSGRLRLPEGMIARHAGAPDKAA